jgi:hypothetical protein
MRPTFDLSRRAAMLSAAAALAACAGTGGLGSSSKTLALQAGMTTREVPAMLGPPASVQQGPAGSVWKYSLHEYYKGWVPYYLLFAGEPASLQAWAADEAEYQRSQAAWLSVISQIQMPARKKNPSGDRDCQNARSWEDRMAYCYGTGSGR